MAEIPNPVSVARQVGYVLRARLLDAVYGLERRIRTRWTRDD